MPSQLIDFGAMSYPTVKTQVELNEQLAGGIVDGYINELKHYVKRQGQTQLADGANAVVQGIYRTRGLSATYVIVVINQVVYDLASNGTLTAYTGDNLNGSASNAVHFTEDINNIFAVNGENILKLDPATKVGDLLTGGNAPSNVTQIGYLDGFLVCNGDIGGGGVQGDLNFSDDIDNGYEASDSWEVFNNEALGDSCTAIAVQWQEIFCFGPDSMEASYNDGSSPFARIDGGISPYGIVAPESLLNIDNTLYFLSRVDGAIRLVRLEGRRPVIASEAYDRQLQGITTITSGRAFAWVDDGKPFYCITFPSPDNITLAFNLRTRQWSQFGHWDGVAASGTLTSTGTAPADGDTVTIGAYAYTFKTALTAPSVAGEVLIGASAAAALDNLKSAVNGTAGAGTTYAEGTLTNDEVTATTNTDTTQLFVAVYTGLFGNSIATTETSSVLSFGAATLTGGTHSYGPLDVHVSAYVPEFQKFLLGSRNADGIITYIGTSGLDNGDTIRMELTSNVHMKGNQHRKFTGTLDFDTTNGNSRFRFRDPGDSWEEFFYSITAGYFPVSQLGEYVSRQYQVVHEGTGQFILMAAEEWYNVGRF